MKICPENPDLANAVEKYPAVYMKTWVRLILLAATGSATTVTMRDCVAMATLSTFHCFTVHFDSSCFIHTNSCTFSYNYVPVF